MNFKKILLGILALLIIAGVVVAIVFGGNKSKENNDTKYKIVASNFASYDFLRAIIGDNKDIELTYLLGPGKDAHSYDPKGQDLVKIQNADIFVYIGGEMEKWADKVLEAVEDDNKNESKQVICIADFVDKLDEEDVDGAEAEEEEEEEEGAFDEHIWTSPANAIKMCEALEKAVEKMDSENAEKYRANSKSYIEKIKDVDNKIREVVDNKVRNRLVFADKMPMQYFINYYGLEVSAAFNGCSTETEPSAKTISYLQNKIKEENIPVVLYIELNPGTVARTLAKDVGNGCEAMQIQALHNVSLDDFNNGETWVSLMTRNIDVLKKALQ